MGVPGEGEPGMVKVYSYFDKEDFRDLPRTVCEDVCVHRCKSVRMCNFKAPSFFFVPETRFPPSL